MTSATSELFRIAEGTLKKEPLPLKISNRVIQREVNALMYHIFNQTEAEITSSTKCLLESVEQVNMTINPPL